MSRSGPASFEQLVAAVADEDRPAIERLVAGAALRTHLDRLLPRLADTARSEEGHSWASIGDALDISRQAAQQRFGKKVRPDAYNVDRQSSR